MDADVRVVEGLGMNMRTDEEYVFLNEMGLNFKNC